MTIHVPIWLTFYLWALICLIFMMPFLAIIQLVEFLWRTDE